MTAFKAQAMARDLHSRLEAAYPGVTITYSLDPNAMPILAVATSLETLFIKIEVEPDQTGAVNGLNIAQTVYSPHQATILRDSTISDIGLRAVCDAETARSGTKLLIYEIHPLPASYNLAGATLVATVKSNQWNPMTLSE